jgi:hypothetical protein
MASMQNSGSGERVANSAEWLGTWGSYRYSMNCTGGPEKIVVTVRTDVPLVSIRIANDYGMEIIDLTPADAMALGRNISTLGWDLMDEKYNI